MSSEQDKRPSLVPLGVFGTTPSAPPKPVETVTSAGVVPAPAAPAAPPAVPKPAAPAPRLDATERTAVPPPADHPPADRPSFPRTLVGVPSLSPEAARARGGDFPAPPKWQGAAAYAGGGAPALRTRSGAPLPPGAQPPPPPPASALSPSAPPPTAPVLGRVNLRSVVAPVGSVSVAGRVAPPPVEEELDLVDAIEEPSASTPAAASRVAPPAPAASAMSATPVSARPGAPMRTELSFDAEEPEPLEEAAYQPATRSSNPPVIMPDFARKDPSEVNIPLAAAVPVVAVPASAPARPVAARPAAVEVDPGAPLLGVMFMLATLVLGVGGWLLTQGGFVRPPHPEVAARERPAIKKLLPQPEKVAEVAAPAPPEPQPVAAPVVEPEAVAPEPAAVAEAEPVATPEPAVAAPSSVATPSAPARPRRAQPARSAEPEPPPPAVTEPAPLTITPQSVEPPLPAGGVLPDTPTREDVTRAMDAVRSQVAGCAGGRRGVAEVDLTVLGTGDVSHVVVTGDFVGTAEGSCIARVVRGARFSPFVKPRFRLIYPFQL